MDEHTINVIYDDRVNFDDKNRLIKEFNKVGIDKFCFWDAVINLPVMVDNISQSHKNIVFNAKKNGLPFVVIAEQDLYFPSADGWNYYLKNKPEVYDVYVGGSYLIDNRCEYYPPLVRVNEWVGNHLITINETYYDRWLSTPKGQHMDSAQAGNGQFFCCFPYPALQRSSKSANHNWQEANYNNLLQEHFIYK